MPSDQVPAVIEIAEERIVVPSSCTSTVSVGLVPPEARAVAPTPIMLHGCGIANLIGVTVAVRWPAMNSGSTITWPAPTVMFGVAACSGANAMAASDTASTRAKRTYRFLKRFFTGWISFGCSVERAFSQVLPPPAPVKSATGFWAGVLLGLRGMPYATTDLSHPRYSFTWPPYSWRIL